MISETITFEDLDGKEITEQFHFGITESEAAEMAVRHHVKGGSDLLDYFQSISDAEDGNAMMDAFKNMIALSVGRESEDRRRFIKTPDIRDDFMQSDAYNKLFLRMVQEPEYAMRFLSGIMPKKVQQDAANKKTEKDFNTQQLLDMSDEEFFSVVGRNEKDWSPATLLVAYQRKSQRPDKVA